MPALFMYTYICRSTPIECLHTILLGPVKYLLQLLMDRLNPREKDFIEARINSFEFSGFEAKLHGRSICRYSAGMYVVSEVYI